MTEAMNKKKKTIRIIAALAGVVALYFIYEAIFWVSTDKK